LIRWRARGDVDQGSAATWTRFTLAAMDPHENAALLVAEFWKL
jgi:hypothetical protein